MSDESLSSLDSRLRKLEEVAAWANEPEKDGVAEQLGQIQTVLLWLSKQPWEVDQSTTWEQLVKAATTSKAEPLKFRESVPTAPPVRDLL